MAYDGLANLTRLAEMVDVHFAEEMADAACKEREEIEVMKAECRTLELAERGLDAKGRPLDSRVPTTGFSDKLEAILVAFLRGVLLGFRFTWETLVILVENHPLLKWLADTQPGRFVGLVNQLWWFILPSNSGVYLPFVDEAEDRREKEEMLEAVKTTEAVRLALSREARDAAPCPA